MKTISDCGVNYKDLLEYLFFETSAGNAVSTSMFISFFREFITRIEKKQSSIVIYNRDGGQFTIPFSEVT